jgi:predicted TPR repeat methyltransferase
LIFTVEELLSESTGGSAFRLNPHGRYSHSRGYVHGALGGADFTVLSIEPAVLRTESGAPVAGLVVTGRKGSSQGGATGAS